MDERTHGQRFAEWLGERVAPHGADGRKRPIDLVRDIHAATGETTITASTVTRWLQGARPDPQNASAAGIALGDEAGALAAAGWAARPSGGLSSAERAAVQRDLAEVDGGVIYVGDLPPEAQRELALLVQLRREVDGSDR